MQMPASGRDFPTLVDSELFVTDIATGDATMIGARLLGVVGMGEVEIEGLIRFERPAAESVGVVVGSVFNANMMVLSNM
jgi:hypothetical protein